MITRLTIVAFCLITQFYAKSQIVHFDYDEKKFKEIIQLDNTDNVFKTSYLFKNIIDRNVNSLIIYVNDSTYFGTIDCFKDGNLVFGDFVRVAYISVKIVVLIIDFGHDARIKSKIKILLSQY